MTESAVAAKVQPLPSSFEEFAEQRKASFMKVKDYKDKGGKLVGYLCSYSPLEIIDAAGAAAVGLCGTSEETIPAAETVLPANLCPLIKSTYGFALTQKCPFTYFSDLIIGETTCDGKKKMYELLDELKPTHILHLPQSQVRPYEQQAWRDEVRFFKEELERRLDVEITDEALRTAAGKRNRMRRAMVGLYELQTAERPVLGGADIMSAVMAAAFIFDADQYTLSMESLVADARKRLEAGESKVEADAKRILLTGCPADGVMNKVVKAIEENGGVTVAFDACSGERSNRTMVDESADDILDAIADRYFTINCSVMAPNTGRFDNMFDMVEKYHVDGIVDVVLTACHTFNVEGVKLQRVMEERGVPYIKVETNYSPGDAGQLETRLAAFIETL